MKQRKVQTQVPAEVYAKMMARATREGVTLAALLRRIVLRSRVWGEGIGRPRVERATDLDAPGQLTIPFPNDKE